MVRRGVCLERLDEHVESCTRLYICMSRLYICMSRLYNLPVPCRQLSLSLSTTLFPQSTKFQFPIRSPHRPFQPPSLQRTKKHSKSKSPAHNPPTVYPLIHIRHSVSSPPSPFSFLRHSQVGALSLSSSEQSRRLPFLLYISPHPPG
jgi:hypothetical protein